MVRCEECGQPNDAAARFCKRCGAALPQRTQSTEDERLLAAEPAQPATDLPEIPDIAPLVTVERVEPDAPRREAHDQASREALAELTNAAQGRLEKLRAEEQTPEPETFAHRDYTSERDYSARDYSAQDYSAQDYGRDYAPRDEPQPRRPLLPPVEMAIREEATLQAPAPTSPQDAKEIDADVKKLGASIGWGCAILFVIWMIVMAVVLFVNKAG
jgi:hypothetical protein